MRLPDFQYTAPESVGELVELLRNPPGDIRVMAGGTDLLPSMKQGLHAPRTLVLLNRLAGLNRIAFDDRNGLTVGPLVKLHELETAAASRESYPALSRAAGLVGSPQLRQMGTVGGNLNLDTRCFYYNQSSSWRSCRPVCVKAGGDTCNAIGGGKKCFAAFSGDLAPVLVALGASVRLRSGEGERTMPLGEYYTGNGAEPFARKDDEVMTGIAVPPPPVGAFSVYKKFSIRKAIDFPLAGVAVVANRNPDGTCRDARVVLGGVAPKPLEVETAAALLEGMRLEKDLIDQAAELAFKAAKPVGNLASTPSYRRLMVRELVKRALLQAQQLFQPDAHQGGRA
jgi:4-hydroxybenzoyl-CoA reductase subunit beta